MATIVNAPTYTTGAWYTNQTVVNQAITSTYSTPQVVMGGAPRQKYWMLTHVKECTLCGKRYTRKERQYSPRPVDKEDRIKVEPFFDYCG